MDSKHLGAAMIAVALAASVVVGYLALALFTTGGDDTGALEGGGDELFIPTRPEGEIPALPASDAEIDLSGRVVDIAGAPIAGVAVTAEAEEIDGDDRAGEPDAGAGGLVLGAVVTAVTDGDGRFALANLGTGHVRLRVEGGGVVPSEVRFVAIPQRDLDVVASREVSIAGHLIGNGVAAGVAIEAAGEGGAGGATTTAADGSFEIAGLPEGVYKVWAASGELGSPALRVERRGAGPFAPIELAMAPAAIISGRLIDAETGAPLAGQVALTHAGDEPGRGAEAGADGRFAIEGVPPGRWYADAGAPGYVGAEQLLFEADRSRALTFALSRGGAIAGVVVDPDGVPIAGALVEADDVAGSGPTRARIIAPRLAGADSFIPRGELGVMTGPIPLPPPQPISAARIAEPIAGRSDADGAGSGGSQRLTDARGRYRIAGLRPGRYRVLASHADFAGGASEVVPIALGAEREGVEVVLERGVRVRGVVRDERGDPIIAAEITASSAAPMPLRARTDLDGRFELPPLSGTITVTASATGYAPASARVTDPDRELELALTRADRSIAGQVADTSGFPIAGARIAVAGVPAAAAVTDPTGRFEVTNLPEGTHEIAVTHPDYPEHATRLEVGRGHQIEVPLGGGVEGLVIETNSRRPMAATVALRPAGKPGASPRTTGAGADGRFSFAPLSPGRYRLTASARGFAPSSVDVEVEAGDRPREITARDVRLELVGGASVAGTVRDENGERVAGAVVRAGSAETRSDIDGRFALVDVPAIADLEITARKSQRRGSISMSLAPGDELTTVEISIEPRPTRD